VALVRECSRVCATRLEVIQQGIVGSRTNQDSTKWA
jgi:hypothetical protein